MASSEMKSVADNHEPVHKCKHKMFLSTRDRNVEAVQIIGACNSAESATATTCAKEDGAAAQICG
jgi:hypothetical protein